MRIAPEDEATMSAALERIDAVLDDVGVGAGIAPQARAEAREAAQELVDASGGVRDGLALAVVAYASALLAPVSDDLAADRERTRRLTDALQTRAGIPRVALGRELLRTRRVTEHPTGAADALEGQLALLQALTGARAVSVWVDDSGGEPRHVAHAGDLVPDSAPVAADARTVLERHRNTPVMGEGTLGVRIDTGRPEAGALIAHGVAPAAPGVGPLLTAAVTSIAGLLEREALLDREGWREPVADAVERRLARVRFDLHDGPQQDVILLAQDVRLFRDQLRPLLDHAPDRARALGRLDDLEAQLLALDGDLRRLSISVQSPFLAPDSLLESLQRVTEAFAKRTGILPETHYSADLTQLSESQQIALLALIQEALSNVRKHGEASSVQISIASDAAGIRAQVSDDGRGFDPETTVARAARAGRLGLVGMHERVRMLGGQTRIDSRPGGPTVVSAVLPRWGTGED